MKDIPRIVVIGMGILLGLFLVASLLALIPFSLDTDGGDFGSCDPIDNSQCVLPYPSSFYLKKDATSSTGFFSCLHFERIPRKLW